MNEGNLQSFPTLKVVLVGDTFVGKTSIVQKYHENAFEEAYINTIGTAFKAVDVELTNGKTIRLHIWDTAGQEKYANLGQFYYRKANVVILIFDITKKSSFKDLKQRRLPSVYEAAPRDAKYILVGNKSDKYEEREVTEEKVAKFKDKFGIPIYIETSAKTGQGIRKLFEAVAEFYENEEKVNKPTASVKVSKKREVENKKGGCC